MISDCSPPFFHFVSEILLHFNRFHYLTQCIKAAMHTQYLHVVFLILHGVLSPVIMSAQWWIYSCLSTAITPASLYGAALHHHLPLMRELGLPVRWFARDMMAKAMLDCQVLVKVCSAPTPSEATGVFVNAVIAEGDTGAMAFFVSLLSSAGFSDLFQTISLCPGATCQVDGDSYHGYSVVRQDCCHGRFVCPILCKY